MALGDMQMRKRRYLLNLRVLRAPGVCTLIAIFILPNCLSLGNAQPLLSISLNASVTGNTSGADTGIFSKFVKLDATQPTIGAGGQHVLQLEIPSETGDIDMEISTCIGSDFDTYIALLNNNPINDINATVIAGSGNDLACQTGRSKGFLSTKVESGTYYVVVTGNGAEEGIYNITVRGSQATPTPVPWGLDRIDQRSLPLNNKYSVRQSGDNVWIYVVDSGVRVSHEQFQGRAQEGYDFVNNERDSAPDCSGHGTHVAGIIAGKTFGVSARARIIAIRVFGCDNKAKSSALVDAIGWILVDSKVKSRDNVIVALMFSTSTGESTILGTTIKGLIRSGIPVIVPAGNNAGRTCEFYPGSIEEFLTVGATDPADDASSFSNSGNCTNIYAPGTAIMSSWHTSDNASRILSGTAQAAAHIVGITANLMALNKNIKSGIVSNILESISTKDIVGKVPSNESTRLGFVRSVPKFEGDPPLKPNVFLFTVFGVSIPLCDGSSGAISSMRKAMKSILSVKDSKLKVQCLSTRKKAAGDENIHMELRVEIPERMAAATFAILERALVTDKENTENLLGYPFTTVEMPWAVDSTPLVFWGAPSFAETESNSMSMGAIAGAVVGAFCLIAILGVLAWISYRKAAKVDEVESMEGSIDMEKGSVHFDDFDKVEETNAVPRSFRNVFKAMKSKSMRNGNGDTDGLDRGMNKMGSFIGGPNSMPVKDFVRMESFGGEAFAGLDSISRNNSMADMDESPHSSQNIALSFRGLNNLVLSMSRRDQDIDQGPESFSSSADDSMRMQSLGGEAFARIGRQLSEDSKKSDPSTLRSESDIMPSRGPRVLPGLRTDSMGIEALASSSEVPREDSFFAGKT